jgi:hypothetical protein
MYRQALAGHDLSIEQGISSVPDDGYYYVLFEGVQQGRFRSLAQATKCYLTIKATLNIEATPAVPPSPDAIRRLAMESKSLKALD